MGLERSVQDRNAPIVRSRENISNLRRTSEIRITSSNGASEGHHRAGQRASRQRAEGQMAPRCGDRHRRHGQRVCGDASQSGARRDQDPACRSRHGRRGHDALPPRGLRRQRRRAPRHGHRARRRRERGQRAVLGDGAAGRANARHDARARARRHCSSRSPAPTRSVAGSAGRRARQRHRASGSEARESVPDQRRAFEGARLRHRALARAFGAKPFGHASGLRARHARVHGTRASAGALGRSRRSYGYLVRRRNGVHAAHRPFRARSGDPPRTVGLLGHAPRAAVA